MYKFLIEMFAKQTNGTFASLDESNQQICVHKRTLLRGKKKDEYIISFLKMLGFSDISILVDNEIEKANVPKLIKGKLQDKYHIFYFDLQYINIYGGKNCEIQIAKPLRPLREVAGYVKKSMKKYPYFHFAFDYNDKVIETEKYSNVVFSNFSNIELWDMKSSPSKLVRLSYQDTLNSFKTNEYVNIRTKKQDNNDFFNSKLMTWKIFNETLFEIKEEIYESLFLHEKINLISKKSLDKNEMKISSGEYDSIILTKTRNSVKQSKFRNDLFNEMKSITKEYFDSTSLVDKESSVKDLLIASHIKPWSQATNFEKTDKNNGLLLTCDVDSLFDKGFISFDCNDGNMIISPLIIKTDLGEQWIKRNLSLQIPLLNKERTKYLQWHLENIFKRK